ncbi:MAG: hypothetical protein ACRC9Y_01965 [Aeromonas veronii]
MKKETQAELQNKHGILHLLKYCRIDRAANMLGCEVSDLLHLWEEEEISLYWKLDMQPAALVPWATESMVNDELATTVGLGSFFIDDFQIDENMSYSSPVLYDSEGKFLGERVLLSGMWYSAIQTENKMLIASTDKGPQIAFLPDQWEWPPLGEMCVMQYDISRLIEAIDTGKPLGGTDNRYPTGHGLAAIMAEKNRVFETKNTCSAIVQLLQALGFTAKELGKTSNGLQKKIAARGISEVLASGITERTLREWMKIGGAR